MAFIAQCDICRKVKLSPKNNFVTFGTTFDFEKDEKIKVKNQIVMLDLNLHLLCGDGGEVCDPCARKLIDKIMGNWGKKNKRKK
jgi:hypothetical protein